MLNSKKADIVISLIVAVILWMYVVGQVDPNVDVTVRNVEIEFLNTDDLEDRGLALAEADTDTVDVVLSGSRSDVIGVDAEDIRATVDLGGLDRGDLSLDVLVMPPKNTRVQDVSPETVNVSIDDLVSETRQVEAEFLGSAANREPGNVSVEPDTLVITGAESNVDKVETVHAQVDAGKIKGSETTVYAETEPVDSRGRTVSYVRVSQDRVSVTATMMHTKTVPLNVETVGEVTDAYQVDSIEIPDEVTVKGAKRDLDDIEEVRGEPIDISGITATVKIPIVLDLPDGVVPAQKSENLTVRVKISDVDLRQLSFSAGDIEVADLQDTYTATVQTERVTVTIRGTRNIVSDVKKSDIRLYVRGKSLGEGVHDLRLRYSCDDNIDVTGISPETVTVRVTHK